jgi:proteasome component ECM29
MHAKRPCAGRYQYDPNARVRDAMAHIWRALVPEPKKALEAHFGAVAAELLREMGGRLWRSREAACAALADLLQARRGLRRGRRGARPARASQLHASTSRRFLH